MPSGTAASPIQLLLRLIRTPLLSMLPPGPIPTPAATLAPARGAGSATPTAARAQGGCVKTILSIPAFLALLAAPGLAESVHTLKQDLLTVTVVADSTRLQGGYGPRFDRTAFVTSARFDDREYLHPNGLCDEFGLNGFGVLGYATAGMGETFIKIGVGRLTRDTDLPYRFSRHYPVEHLFPVEVNATAEEIVATQIVPDLYTYRKRYRLLAGRTLEIAYTLTNTSDSPLPFETYNHNWLAFADATPPFDYRIETAFDIPGEPPDAYERTGRIIRIRNLPSSRGVNWATDLEIPVHRHHVTVRVPDGRELVIGGDFAVQHFALWGNHTALSPELFLRTTLAPAAKLQWRRHYTFIPARITASSALIPTDNPRP